MKKQKKLTMKVRDLTPLNNVTGGRRRHAHGLQAEGFQVHPFPERGEGRTGIGLNAPQ